MDYDKIVSRSARETFDKLAEKLKTEKKLYYIRFGDGDIEIMQGTSYRNHQATSELTREMKEGFLIEDPNYLIGLSINMPVEKKSSKGICSQYPQNDEMLHYLVDNGLIQDQKIYESQTCFTYMTLFHPQETFRFFEDHIRYKPKMFIGGVSQEVAEKLYGKIDHYVQTPRRNSYKEINDWWPNIMEKIDHVELVIVSAGTSSNIVAKRLWYENKPVQLLDIGSIIDPIDGKVSRTWIRHLGHRVQRILPKEHRESSLLKITHYMLKDLKYLIRRNIVSRY